MTPLKVVIFGCRDFEKSFLKKYQPSFVEIIFIEENLNIDTASKSGDAKVVSIFSKDDASSEVLDVLNKQGVRLITLRSAGYNNVDLEKAKELGMQVSRVPSYSPEAIAEHSIALILGLSRHLIKADRQVHQFNFALDGLMGFNLQDKTVGIIGTGNIGKAAIRILNGFGCKMLAYDLYPESSLEKKYTLKYVDLETLISNSDIISLYVPLNAETKYMINKAQMAKMKNGVMIINTGRGKLIHTLDLIDGLATGKVSAAGLDVYENEAKYFFKDHSTAIIEDETLKKLLSFENVLLTGHQAFFTETALENIARITFENITNYKNGIQTENFLL